MIDRADRAQMFLGWLGATAITFVVLACGESTPTAAPGRPSPGPSLPPSQPGASLPPAGLIEATPCPSSHDDSTGEVSCGYLTVPEERSAQNGRTIKLFFTRVRPQIVTAEDPMVALGGDMPWQTFYRGTSGLAPRVGREVVMLDQRGSGYSQPSLACSELDDLGSTAGAGRPSIDGFANDELLGAIRACHDRLVSGGIDLDSYGLTAAADDVEDLRLALGFEAVNLITFGSASRVAFEVVRRHPGGIRSVIADSPDVPQLDQFTEAIMGIRSTIIALEAACDADAACASAYPDVAGSFAAALAALEADPVDVPVGSREVVMDGAQVLRSYRSAFTLPEYLPYMPDSFATVADPKLREFRADDDFLQGLLDYPPLLHGYGTPWDPELGPSFGIEPGEFSHGVQYTLTCREELPSFDRAAADRLAAGETAFVRAYIDSIWTEICAIWNVAPGAADTNAPVSSDIPTLFLVGRFDAASPLQAVTELATGFSRGHLVEVPPLAHYTLNGDLGVCPREIRNAWVQSPENPPVTSCLAGMPRISFEVP